MAKDKERTVNPATAALKASKARTIKKSRAAVAAQRAERNSHRDPGRLEHRIADLQARREASKGGRLPPAEEKALAELERDLGRVRRAREKAGIEDKPPQRNGGWEGGRGGGVLGKRRRDGNQVNDKGQQRRDDGDDETDGSDTDPEARDIPMPTDHEHEPPVPARRRKHLPLPPPAHVGPHALPAKPGAPPGGAAAPAEQKTVYAAAPQVRDLQKEAVKRFVPAVVASKLAAVRGEGGRLVEPEEADRLEREGYRAGPVGGKVEQNDVVAPEEAAAEGERPGDDAERDDYDALAKLEEEERRFREEAQAKQEMRVRQSMRQVQIEEVEDEDL